MPPQRSIPFWTKPISTGSLAAWSAAAEHGGLAHALSSMSQKATSVSALRTFAPQALPSWKASTGSSSPPAATELGLLSSRKCAVRRIASLRLIFAGTALELSRLSRLRSRLFVERSGLYEPQ